MDCPALAQCAAIFPVCNSKIAVKRNNFLQSKS